MTVTPLARPRPHHARTPHLPHPGRSDARTARAVAPAPARRPAPEAPDAGAPRPGFVLYVGLDPRQDGGPAALVELAETLGELARDALPGAETYTALSLAPAPVPDAAEELRSFRDRLARLSPVPQVVIDAAARRVTVNGTEARLTARELALLTHLARADGRAVGRAELLATVWAGNDVADGSRTVDVHVRRLRRKLGADAVITTVRGVGYRFDPRVHVLVRDDATA